MRRIVLFLSLRALPCLVAGALAQQIKDLGAMHRA